jgi:DNA-binding Xre family transcriptional regulator
MRGNMTTGGDLGRRVARRRGELGLTIEQLAVRVQMSARYLEYLEGHAAIAGIDTLLRLADALEISLSDLLGEHADWPRTRPGLGPGHRGPAGPEGAGRPCPSGPMTLGHVAITSLALRV